MAQIITTFEGINNQDLVAASARLTAQAPWKKQRIVYIIPGGKSIPARVYTSHRGLIFPPNQAMTPIYVEGAEVGAAFQQAIDIVLGNPELRTWEYVLTIEHDNLPQPNHVLKLLEAMEKYPQYSAISGLYWTKGGVLSPAFGPDGRPVDGDQTWTGTGVPQIWGDITDPVPNYRPCAPRYDEVVECYGLGMGFCLYRMEMFKRLDELKVERPWFKTIGCNSGDRGVGTQDLYFWGNKARPNGFRCAVDCSVRVGHYDERTEIPW